MTLRATREMNGLTQAQAAALLGVSLRSYKTYETDPLKAGTAKYRYFSEQLAAHCLVDETHGVLSLARIREACAEVLASYPVTYAYLFGSYARGTAGESSDVDLLVSGGVDGLRFYGMVDALRSALCKRVDVLTPAQLERNRDLLDEILRDGVKIYGKPQE